MAQTLAGISAGNIADPNMAWRTSRGLPPIETPASILEQARKAIEEGTTPDKKVQNLLTSGGAISAEAERGIARALKDQEAKQLAISEKATEASIQGFLDAQKESMRVLTEGINQAVGGLEQALELGLIDIDTAEKLALAEIAGVLEKTNASIDLMRKSGVGDAVKYAETMQGPIRDQLSSVKGAMMENMRRTGKSYNQAAVESIQGGALQASKEFARSAVEMARQDQQWMEGIGIQVAQWHGGERAGILERSGGAKAALREGTASQIAKIRETGATAGAAIPLQVAGNIANIRGAGAGEQIGIIGATGNLVSEANRAEVGFTGGSNTALANYLAGLNSSKMTGLTDLYKTEAGLLPTKPLITSRAVNPDTETETELYDPWGNLTSTQSKKTTVTPKP